MTLRATRAAVLAIAGLTIAMTQLRRRFQFAVVNGESMNPTFRHGDLVVGRRDVAILIAGDAIVFTIHPSDYRQTVGPEETDDAPKRIVLPRDGLGRTWLGKRLKRVIAVAGDPAPLGLPETLRRRHGGLVPAGHVAVAGDNPLSEGSAQFGYVDVRRVESVVIRRLQRRHHLPRAFHRPAPSAGPVSVA